MTKINMKRKVDNIGRVTIPNDLRRITGISENDKIEFIMKDGDIVIKKIENRCVFCGTTINTYNYKGKYVCACCFDIGEIEEELPGMSIEEFQEKSRRTMRDAEPKDMILNCCLGTTGEFAEVTEHIKKHFFQGHIGDVDKVEEELGDTMFYIVNLASALGIDMRKVLENNVKKLEKRYPNGFSSEDSVKRVDYAERV